MRRFMIAGLSGSGKTTTAQGLAARHGLPYFSGSTFRATRLGLDLDASADSNRRFWAEAAASVEADRARIEDGGRERSIDFDMLDAYRDARDPGVVFDVWFLPWLAAKDDKVKVLLDVPPDQRRARLGLSGDGAEWLGVLRKDEASMAFGAKEYGIDMTDTSAFDVVVSPPPEVTPEEVIAAVSAAHDVAAGEPRNPDQPVAPFVTVT